jgi:hypothetical protein
MLPEPESTPVTPSAPTAPRDPNTVGPPPAAAAAAAAGERAATGRQAIDDVLGRYQAAFTQLDAQAARSVWPAVDSRALARSFAQLESQTLSFDSCAVDVTGARATARCSGTAMYVPKVGNRRARSEDRHWILDLRNTGDRWIITAVDTQ